MGTNNGPYIMTLVNSIVGVSILAMPFCYKQCGIVLASLILVFSNLMTRLSCHYLLKSAIMTRRRTFELLAFHALGSSGKTAIELSIILLMIGTCIAFFVVMGDLGPAIIGSLLRVEYFPALRPAVLIGIAVCVVLPLGFLRNVDSLSTICTASFFFYLLLVIKVFIESMDNLFYLSWIDEVDYWRPAGLLQCLPIFSMALSCQSQLLEIFDSVQNGTLDRMSSIVKSAVNLCTALYMGVGFFGYIAYYKQPFTGNLLMSFSQTHFSEFIKMGFVLSVAVTFPMVIFPCRTSLHSLLFKKMHTPHYELVTGGGNHIPEAQFKCITFFIITSSLIVGLLAPNIEIVLGLLGSTIGVIICVLCPPFLFIWISGKATTEKVLAQAMCAFGIFIMIMGTYANIYINDSVETVDVQLWKQTDNIIPASVHLKSLEEKNIVNFEKNHLKSVSDSNKVNGLPAGNSKLSDVQTINKIPVSGEKEENKRIEPPIPIDPEVVKIPKIELQKQALEPARIVTNDIEKSKIKNEAGDQKFGKIYNSSKAKLNLSDSQKLLQEQKEVLEKIRDKKPNDVKIQEQVNDIPKAAERKMIDTIDEVKPEVGSLQKVKKTGDPKEQAEQVVKLVSLNDIQKVAQEQPPLPLLVKAQNDADLKVKSNNVVQRDLLQNNKKGSDREKRDLDYVTNASRSENIQQIEKEISPKSVDVENLVGKPPMRVKENGSSNSFVKNVANSVNNDPVCEKDGAILSETDKEDALELPSKLPKEGGVMHENAAKNLSLSKPLNSKKLLQVKNTEENQLVENDESPSKKKIIPELLVQEIIQPEEKVAVMKESLILTPLKLSDPALLLQDKLYVDEKKPIVMRPLSRNLKTVDKESVQDKKK